MDDCCLKFLDVGTGTASRSHRRAAAPGGDARAVLARWLQIRHERHQGGGAGRLGRQPAGAPWCASTIPAMANWVAPLSTGPSADGSRIALAVFERLLPRSAGGGRLVHGGLDCAVAAAGACRSRAAMPEPRRVAGLVLIAPAVDFTEELMWKRMPAEVRRADRGAGLLDAALGLSRRSHIRSPAG